MTTQQRKIARHALGLPNRFNKSYRNRYIAAPGHESWGDLETMVAAGWAHKEPFNPGDFWFGLTKVGAKLALDKGEKLDAEDFPISKAKG